MTKEEIEFVRMLLIELYIYDFKIIDTNPYLLEEFMNFLQKTMYSENLIEDNPKLKGIFEKDILYDNYQKFINMILYITHYPKYSKYDEIEKRIYLDFDEDYIYKYLNQETKIDKEKIESLVINILTNHELWPHKRYIKYIKR